jgi:hypothetical protein
MAQPVEVFGNIKGMTRDFAVDALPEGYLWDLVDGIPLRKGARIEQRGAWQYFGASAHPGTIWGGYYAAFTKGQRLLAVSNSLVHDVDTTSGAISAQGAGPATMVQNGVKLRDRVYFMDGAGLTTPRVVTFDGVSFANAALPATAPKAKVAIAYKDRLVAGGDPANPAELYFSPLETDGGPPAAWDALSHVPTNNEITGLAGMAGQILVFHPAMIERVRGSIPPETDVEPDMYVETLTDQVGCVQPHTIVPWRENIIFADERGVFITDGATVRNLTELGGIGDFWRLAYGSRISGQGVSCGTFLDYLVVTINCQVPPSTSFEFTMICDLNTRSWFRFSNFPATCYIPSESAMEELYAGHYVTNKLTKVSSMFQDAVPIVTPHPDYVDGNAVSVLPTFTTGFKRLAKNEGLQRIRNVLLSYHHESFLRALTPNGVKIEYRTDPPTPEDLDMTTGGVVGWTEAGRVPDTNRYSRKKLPIGKSAYGLMLRVTSLTPSRTNRFFSVDVETTAQDRGKVTSRP